MIDNFTFIMLTIIVPAFDLGMSFGKVLVWKRPEKVWKFILKIA